MQYEQPASLPTPDELSATHSARVVDHLRLKIAATADRRISFAEFMHEALYAPGLGYYSAGSTKFGADGDFTTAPEVSSVFGKVLARQTAELLRSIGAHEILEIGAGSGKLAADMLIALENLDALPATYNILEVSPDLQDRQQKRLREDVPQLFDRIKWLSDLPKNLDGVIVANEVLDALPVTRFVRRETGVFEYWVTLEDEEFGWAEIPATEQLATAVAAIEADLGERLADGFTSEVSLAAPYWIADLAKCLRNGAILLFDYGVSRREYYAVDRADGWLRCHFRHHVHNNPLLYPGIQDLTAWVDFSLVADAAVRNELQVIGYQTQSHFLMGGGLEIEMQGFEELPLARQLELSGQIKTLTLPGEMGENFKCIALGRGEFDTPSAFEFADRTQTL